MLSRASRSAAVAALLLLGALLLPPEAYAQSIEEIDDWFYSRLAWGAFVGALLGGVIGIAHLCRLEFQVRARNAEISVDGRARRKFGVWLLVIFFVGALLLFLDTWLVYEFGSFSLEFWEALGRVWLNYRTLLVLAVTLAAFTLLVALVTRLKGDCRCRYAFIPGPRGK